MLYFLLVIIAIGVLLASEPGQELLKALWILVLIAGGLYLAFWIVIVAIAFFTSGTGKSFVSETFQFIGGVIAILFLYKGGNYLIKTAKNEEKRMEILRKSKAGLHHAWKHQKGWIIFIAVYIALIIYLNYFSY